VRADDLSNSQSEYPAELFETGVQPPRLWRPEELRTFLRLQLAAPLFPDLKGFAPEQAARLQAALAADS